MSGEQFTADLRRNSVTWKFIDLAGLANPAAPTLAELNSTNVRLVFDPTCALDEENTTFTVGSSELDETLTFCDSAGVSRPTQVNPEVALAIRRDKDRNANGVFNMALNWLKHVGTEFYILERVGDQDTGPRNGVAAAPFTTADHVRIMRVSIDYPVDTLAQGSNALLSSTPLPGGFLAWNINPVA